MALSLFELCAGGDLIDSWAESDSSRSCPFDGETVNRDLMLKIFDEHMALSIEGELFTGEQDVAVHKIIETPFVTNDDGSIIKYDDESSVLIQSTTAQWAMLRSAE
jgi:hypothetical protein